MRANKSILNHQETGLVQIYINSTEKTNFAPYGLALRASGYGLGSLITRFVHHDLEAGETVAMELLAPGLVIDGSALDTHSPNSAFPESAVEKAFQKAAQAASSGEYDLVILDGVLELVSKGIISIRAIHKLIDKKADRLELILTGSEPAADVLARADLVTEMVAHSRKTNACGTSAEVVTGDGKGKTTYCLGKALLMSSMGVPVFMLQIIKSPKPYGETTAILDMPSMEIRSMGKGFVNKENAGEGSIHKKAAREAWEGARKIVLSGQYGIVVLDEINIAVHYGFIQPDEVVELIEKVPEGLHLMLSGRYAHPEIISAVSTTVEMKEIKHPYKTGVRARKGIEY